VDRYSILLGKKKIEPLKGFWRPTNEHSWNYPDRLRFMVVSDRGGGKTSYLIKDAIETSHHPGPGLPGCRPQLPSLQCLFVHPKNGQISYLHQLAALLARYKSHLNHESFDLCSWESFQKRVQGRRFRSIYFDDGDCYDMSIVTGAQIGYYPLFQLMSFAQNQLSNVPRVIITVSSIGNIIPKGNWNWKIEHIQKEDLCF